MVTLLPVPPPSVLSLVERGPGSAGNPHSFTIRSSWWFPSFLRKLGEQVPVLTGALVRSSHCFQCSHSVTCSPAVWVPRLVVGWVRGFASLTCSCLTVGNPIQVTILYRVTARPLVCSHWYHVGSVSNRGHGAGSARSDRREPVTGGNQRTPVSHPVAGVVTVGSNGNTVNGAGHRNGSCGGLVPLYSHSPIQVVTPGAGSARSDRREPVTEGNQ